ncbi:hypothetical protein [Geodermatophilus sp. SYSU D00815]
MPTMTPTERMAAILRRLARAPHDALVTTGDLRALSPDDYDGESGDRTLRRDLEQLRLRGFVETGITDHFHGAWNRTGVHLVRRTEKDPALHLSAAEHAALQRARARFRPGPALVEVRRGRGNPLDVVLAVVRHLEEGTGSATGRHLAEVLGVDLHRLHEALYAFVVNPVRDPEPDRPALDGLDLVGEYDEETDELVDFQVWLADASGTRATASVSPAYGRGLYHLGRFGYSPAETLERLDLIDTALDSGDTSPSDAEALLRAHRKLSRWLCDLTGEDRQAVS